jgi:exodeoxyribonuclease VII large subunit
MPGSRSTPRILTISQLTFLVQKALETSVGAVWVGGELSNVKVAPSGHLYCTLKDEQSQLQAVMFRSAAQTLPFQPRDGMDVVVLGRLAMYPQRGQLQLYVEAMEPRGLGALRLAFDQLKQRLEAEGLFAAERKRSLPTHPRTVGIVTARHGAVIHDMRVVLRRRWPLARVLVRPVRVQGDGAAAEIAAGIRDMNRVPGVDVLIVGRGGGSLEDLWAFNEEVVARAIAASRIPVVSAVGHEGDVTIADFVADVRAPTPTAAAALVVPDREAIVTQVDVARMALRAALRRRVSRAQEHLRILTRGLGSPRRRVDQLTLRVDDLSGRLRQGLARRVAWDQRELRGLAQRLERSGPTAQLAQARGRLDVLTGRLAFALDVRLRDARAELDRASSRLAALSPLACLARGYAIVRRGDAGGPVVHDATALAPGDTVDLLFARGRATGRIDRTEPA